MTLDSISGLPIGAERRSIPYADFIRMFEGVDEPTLRRLAMSHIREIAPRFEGTILAQEGMAIAEKDTHADDPHAWIGEVLGLVERTLIAYPPFDADWSIRREALLLLDYPLHVEGGDTWLREVVSFYRRFLSRAVQGIANTSVTEGLRIWKLYNMGFVVKSPRHAIGFDIHPGRAPLDFLNEREQRTLAESLEFSTVSHSHEDHADIGFLRCMLDAGKTVVLPPDTTPELTGDNVLRLRDDYQIPTAINGVKVYSHAGFQADAPNNIYVAEVDGYVISQNGDNADPAYYAQIGERPSIDVLLANCWSGMNEYAAATNPRLLITGHENELEHGITHRVPFKNTFGNLDRLELAPPWRSGGPQVAILACGECLNWVREMGIVLR